MDVFDLEIDTTPAYASSFASTASSLPDLEEARTPLLYDSKISSSSRLPSFDEHMIDTLDLTVSTTTDSWPATEHTLPALPTALKTPAAFLESTDVIDETISKGTSSLKNNYKLWLMSTTH